MSLVVFGSINIDLSVRVPRFPKAGETLTASDFFISKGGKGANQAVFLAKLGVNVELLGRVGDDGYGLEYLDYLHKFSIKTDHVTFVNGINTGTAIIYIIEDGQNSIAIVPGANRFANKEYLESVKSIIKEAECLMVQLEIPLDTVLEAIEFACANNIRVILDPAPAKALPDSAYGCIDYITPNETEAEILTSIHVTDHKTAEAAAMILLNKGVRNVVLKAGASGSYLFNKTEKLYAEPFVVDAIDSTAAGDVFNSALAYCLSLNYKHADALRFANAASAVKIQRLGAQTGMPDDIDDIKKLMDSQPKIKVKSLK